jgi:two-component system, LytTR family, response regulator LytT
MKIVVCDDDALVYEQMKNIIASYSIVKNENLELTFYQTVEELLHAKHKYDILFLDIRFNNCDIGIDVAKKLRKAGNTSLIILLTSLHSKAIEGYEIGAYRYIVKPIIKEKNVCGFR